MSESIKWLQSINFLGSSSQNSHLNSHYSTWATDCGYFTWTTTWFPNCTILLMIIRQPHMSIIFFEKKKKVQKANVLERTNNHSKHPPQRYFSQVHNSFMKSREITWKLSSFVTFLKPNPSYFHYFHNADKVKN